VRNEEVLHRAGEGRISLRTIKRRKANWFGHVLCRNCLLKYSFERKIEVRIEVTGGRGKSRKQLQGDLSKTRGFWKLKEDALDHALWRTGFGRGYGPVVRQTVD